MRDFRLADAAIRAGRLAATSVARETRWQHWQTYIGAMGLDIRIYNRQLLNKESEASQDLPSEFVQDTTDEVDKCRLQRLQAQLLPLGR